MAGQLTAEGLDPHAVESAIARPHSEPKDRTSMPYRVTQRTI
jgi:hypothetical protein